MPRTREFNVARAIDDATRVFWRTGFGDTSIDDLVAGTGVSRYGLYSVFGSKEGLFLAVLDHYREKVVTAIFGPVEQDDASLPQIQGYFDALVRYAARPVGARGCLMCNVAVEPAMRDRAIAAKVAGHQNRLRAGFKAALERACRRGEVRAGLEIDASADFLTGLASGISLATRSRMDRGRIANMARLGLAALH